MRGLCDNIERELTDPEDLMAMADTNRDGEVSLDEYMTTKAATGRKLDPISSNILKLKMFLCKATKDKKLDPINATILKINLALCKSDVL
jgi:hypothetical protein